MRKLYYLLLPLMLTFSATAQEDQKPGDLFEDAEYYRLYEEYIEALPLYQKLLNQSYDNAHINYRIGECYLNIPGKKEKSIPHFTEAIKNMDHNFREGSLREKDAPVYALFYIGKAYQIKNELEKAISFYHHFLDTIQDPENYNMNFVRKQIQTCKRAKELMNNPTHIDQKNLGDQINDNFSNLKPVVNSNEDLLIYSSELQFYDAIFMAEKSDGEWNEPINLATQIKSEGNLYPCALSQDANRLVLFRSEPYQGDLYISKYSEEDGQWKLPQKLGNKINTRFWETHGCLGPDNQTLYFTSNRKEGFGGLDIYVSYFDTTENKWGEPQNLGEHINTPYNEETPFITADGERLYFSSQGHEGMGGFDVFYAENIDTSGWSQAINIGYPISTTDDDLFFYPIQNGNVGYMAKYSKQGYGNHDIYRFEIYSEDNPKQIKLEGEIILSQKLKDMSNKDLKLTIDSLNGAHIKTLVPKEDSLSYSFMLNPGSYQLTFQGKGYDTQRKKIHLSWNYPRKSYRLNPTLKPRKKLDRNELIQLPNILFGFDESKLDPAAQKKLDTLARILNKYPDLEIKAVGHTDAIGNESYNQKLSRKRTQSVIAYLTDQGISQNRIHQNAKGEQFPVALNAYQDGEDCPEGRKYNRRVEIVPISETNLNIVGYAGHIPNGLRKKDVVYYTVQLLLADKKLPVDYFDQFPALKKYSIEMFRNGKYIYTLGKFENQAAAIDAYYQAINLNFDKARIISSYQLEEMLNLK
jgi:outer membrane protein OmpA-like peptidoglycan-associated protein